MYDMNAWKALGVLIENWHGELSTTIEVGTQTGVTARKVDLYHEQGSSTVTRRFDFARDLKSVKRKFADSPLYCRISPRGAGEESGDGYGRKIRITDVNDGKDYLEYAPMVDVCKIPDGSGYIYPTVIIENSNCKTPTDLLAWARTQLVDACTPKVTYDVDVIQAGIEGVDVSGVSLGDTVQIVDRYFGDGLRLSGRVVAMTVDEINERQISVTLGSVSESLSNSLARLAGQLSTVTAVVQNINGGTMSTADYLSNLLDRLNAEINATGGYTYITQGQGLRTYDTAVSDPLIGAEASAVVELKGGTIRIANSKTSGGDWEWKSVLQSGFIAAEVITANNITAGKIQSVNGRVYFDLDNNELACDRIVSTTTATTVDNTIAQILARSWGSGTTIRGLQIYSTSYPDGYMLLAPKNNETYLAPTIYSKKNGIYLEHSLDTGSRYKDWSYVGIDSGGVAGIRGTSYLASSADGNARIYCFNGTSSTNRDINADCYNMNVVANGTFTVTGRFQVNGSKSRIVDTEHYNDRLLYCYETPSPMFGDIGSGTLDDYGCCYVMVDDIFAETARTDFVYQVFLQKCGEGDCWVEEKTSTYFVVRGTPGLSFDWEMKCVQAGYEQTRFEQFEQQEAVQSQDGIEYAENAMFVDEYLTELDALLMEEIEA